MPEGQHQQAAEERRRLDRPGAHDGEHQAEKLSAAATNASRTASFCVEVGGVVTPARLARRSQARGGLWALGSSKGFEF